jgi:hypothetical protein
MIGARKHRSLEDHVWSLSSCGQNNVDVVDVWRVMFVAYNKITINKKPFVIFGPTLMN